MRKIDKVIYIACVYSSKHHADSRMARANLLCAKGKKKKARPSKYDVLACKIYTKQKESGAHFRLLASFAFRR